MAVSTIHVLHGIQTPASFYSQLDNAQVSPTVDQMLGVSAGLPYPLFRGVRGLKPEVTFTTSQLATLIGQCGVSCADLSAGNTDLYWKKVTDAGVREADATATHTRLRMSAGWLYWKSISARHQQEATADCRLVAGYDGTNAPIVAAGSTALSGTPTAAEFFGLGPIAINGATLAGCQEATIDLGIETIERGSASEPYNTFLAIKSYNPVITLRGLAVEPFASYGVVGTPLTSLVVYLRKLNNDAAAGLPYVADATAQHIKFTAAAGLVTVESARGGANNEADTGLKIYLQAANAAASPLVVALNQAIV